MDRIAVFWTKVNKGEENECWNWKAGTNGKRGYGRFWDGERQMGAHVFSYKLHFGPVPAPLNVLHKCDNRKCVNPGHLFLGTNLDNNKDMENKCRSRHPKGSDHGRSKLTEQMVITARKLYRTKLYSFAEICELLLLDISIQTISYAIRGKTWKHI